MTTVDRLVAGQTRRHLGDTPTLGKDLDGARAARSSGRQDLEIGIAPRAQQL